MNHSNIEQLFDLTVNLILELWFVSVGPQVDWLSSLSEWYAMVTLSSQWLRSRSFKNFSELFQNSQDVLWY